MSWTPHTNACCAPLGVPPLERRPLASLTVPAEGVGFLAGAGQAAGFPSVAQSPWPPLNLPQGPGRPPATDTSWSLFKLFPQSSCPRKPPDDTRIWIKRHPDHVPLLVNCNHLGLVPQPVTVCDTGWHGKPAPHRCHRRNGLRPSPNHSATQMYLTVCTLTALRLTSPWRGGRGRGRLEPRACLLAGGPALRWSELTVLGRVAGRPACDYPSGPSCYPHPSDPHSDRATWDCLRSPELLV